MIEDGLQELVGDDREAQLVSVPDEHPRVLHGRDTHLEILICRYTEPLWRVQELVWKYDVQCSPVLGHYQSKQYIIS